MHSLTWPQITHYRLTRQRLLNPALPTDLAQLVSATCGIQAQIITAAELAIGARVEGATQQSVREEIWERRTIVKTYGPRNTLHLLPASELPLWMAAMRAREALRKAPWYAPSGLTLQQAETLLDAIGEALDGKCLTREELASDVAARVGPWANEKLMSTWGEYLSPAASLGRLCFGPSRGSKVTFVRADQWIAPHVWLDLDPEESLLEVLRRYLTAYGPATYRDFARWFWLEPAQSRQLFSTLAPDLSEVTVEGARAWILPQDLNHFTSAQQSTDSLFLLPQYDCYVLGAVPRDRLVSEAAKKRIRTYGRGRLEGAVGVPVLVIDGVVAGIWERRASGKHLAIRVEPFVSLSSQQHTQLEAEAVRTGNFLGLDTKLVIGTLD